MSTYINAELRCLVEDRASDCCEYCKMPGEFSFLFHPRHQSWPEHFNLVNGQILGLTAVGRTTVKLLQFNRPDRRSERQKYIKSFLPHN
jgi:hypothetical protein